MPLSPRRRASRSRNEGGLAVVTLSPSSASWRVETHPVRGKRNKYDRCEENAPYRTPSSARCRPAGSGNNRRWSADGRGRTAQLANPCQEPLQIGRSLVRGSEAPTAGFGGRRVKTRCSAE